jgi:hypothetical protein
MPFTISHVAAVLPGYRVLSRAHLFSAAVVGSMVPDFGLLLPGSPGRFHTHSLPALFTYCLPMGLAAYALTLALIKPAVMEIVPDGAYARLRAADAAAPPMGLRSWWYAALAILLGAVTHLLWDTFTHENAAGVRMFPVLNEYAPELDGHTLQFYRWAQYGSSVIGLLVVIAALVLWLRHTPSGPGRHPPRRLRRAERLVWISLYFVLPLLAIPASLWQASAAGLASRPVGVWLERIAIAGMRASIVSLVLVSGLLCLRLARARPVPRP